MRAKMFLMNALIATLSLSFVVAGYVGWAIYDARAYTVREVLPAIREKQLPLLLKDLSARQRQILLAVKDPNFYRHDGVDSGRSNETTITQSIVHYFYSDGARPLFAELRQSLIARHVVTPLLKKDDQLLWYVNTTRLGPDTHGFAVAARKYYDKSFQQLTEDEFIGLVAICVDPRAFDFTNKSAHSKERIARIKQTAAGGS